MGIYVKVDVLKQGSNPGLGGNKKEEIIFFDWGDVDLNNLPARDDKGIVVAGNLVFKPNAYMIKVYGTVDTIKNNTTSEGDADAKGITQSVEFSHPGSSVEAREFRYNWMNRNIGILVDRCSTHQTDLYGWPCAPLQMVFNHEDDKDKNKTTFTLKSTIKGPDVADYRGTKTFDTVTAIVAADAAIIDIANGDGRYQLTDGAASAAALTSCSNAVDGRVITLLGSGGTYPSTITAGAGVDFLLKDGTAWTALAGSQITFKAVKIGASTFKYIEQSRA